MIKNAVAVAGTADVYRLVLSGKVYAPDAPAVEAELKKAVDKGAKHIVLACFSLEQVDSAVLSAIIAGLEDVKKRRSGRVVFMGLNETVKRILTITKMDRFFGLAADETEALAMLAEPAK
jgi:anti-anti-sigma factor